MNITGWICNSCACVGIQSLGKAAGPKEAMQVFCKTQLVSADTIYGSASHPYITPHAFYVFVAGPEVPGFSHSSKTWLKYGTEFAAFIEENKLGPVVSPGQTLNLKHHPGEKTTCQTWVWMPDKEALIKWWEAHKLDNPPQALPVPTPVVAKAPRVPKPPKVVRTNGNWDHAYGIAGGHYKCPHCNKGYVKDEPVWFSEGIFYCEEYGKLKDTP